MAKKYSNNLSVNSAFLYLVLVVLAKAQEAQEDLCGTCQATNGRFACLDENTYSFCYNSNKPDVTSTRHCPTGFYCNINVMSVCSSTSTSSPSCIPTTPTTTTTSTISTTPTISETDTTFSTPTISETEPTSSTPTILETDTTFKAPTFPETDTTFKTPTIPETEPTSTSPTIPTTDITSTTPTIPTADPTPTIPTTSITSTSEPTTSTPTAPVPFDPVIFCSNMKSTGNFKLESDTTCKRYIYCYKLSGQLLGAQYICEGYYNSSTRKCQNTLPDNC